MPNQNEVTFPVQNDVLVPLFAVLDALGAIARRMHPSGLGALVATLTDRDQALRSAVQAMDVAADADPAAWAGIRRRGTRSGWHRPSPCRRATPCAGQWIRPTRCGRLTGRCDATAERWRH